MHNATPSLSPGQLSLPSIRPLLGSSAVLLDELVWRFAGAQRHYHTLPVIEVYRTPLGGAVGRSIRSISRQLAKLESLGLIRRLKQHNFAGRWGGCRLTPGPLMRPLLRDKVAALFARAKRRQAVTPPQRRRQADTPPPPSEPRGNPHVRAKLKAWLARFGEGRAS